MKISHLIRHTAIYGLATVLPRVLNLLLTPLHTQGSTLTQEQYGVYQGLFAYMILGNVLLTYGMETAFFRFMNREEDPRRVAATTLTSLLVTTMGFLCVSLVGAETIATLLDYPVIYIKYAVWILALDTLVAIPFAWYRNEGKSLRYASIKIANVTLNLGLNLLFLLYFPRLAQQDKLPEVLTFTDNTQYIFLANLIASAFTLAVVLPLYRKIGLCWDYALWKKLFRYAFPVLIAGIAFSVNEAFDRIFIRMLYPAGEADTVVGMYAGCYKMGVFMTLFITAYKLGVEPFFFSSALDKKAPTTYAKVTTYFTIFSGGILLFVCVYIDLLKWLLIPNQAYWEGLQIVPFILLANLCLGIYHSMSVWYKVTDRTHWGAIISVIGGGITIVANLTLIPAIGYLGAAVATLLAYAGMMLISYWVGQYKYPVPYGKGVWGFLLLAVLLSAMVFYGFQRNLYIGTLCLISYAVLAFGYLRKQIRTGRS